MSKRKNPTHRTPGVLDPFVRGGGAADRLGLAPITGVVRPEPLRELSLLLGIDVEDVRRGVRMKHRNGGRARGSEQPKVWFLITAPGLRGLSFTSDDLRRPDRLNELMTYRGRDPELRPLSKEDGRRALRLMHQVVESKQQQQADQHAEHIGTDNTEDEQ